MGTSAAWCGSGFQRILIGFSLGQVGIIDKAKLAWFKGGRALHFHQLYFAAEVAWSLIKGGGGGRKKG
jgi:hypothetical protein